MPLCKDISNPLSGDPGTACKEANPGCSDCNDWGGRSANYPRSYFAPTGKSTTNAHLVEGGRI